MDKLKIIKSTALFTIVSFVGRLTSIPKNIIIGLVLMPNEFGQYNSIFLWFSYLMIINIGLLSAAARESGHYFGQEGKENIAINIQNKSIIIDFILTIIICIAFFIFAIQQETYFLVFCYLLVGITYILTKISSTYERFNSARNLFTSIAMVNLIGYILGPVLIMVTIHYFKIYSLFIIPIIVLLVQIAYYIKKLPIKFHLVFDISGMNKLLYAGIFLGIGSIFSSLHQIIDRTFIKLYLNDTIMGLYSFSMIISILMMSILSNLQSVFSYTLNKYSATVEKRKLFKETYQYLNYLLIFSLMLIIVSQLLYYILVNYFVVNYKDSCTIFIIYSTISYFYAIFIIPNAILSSSVMRKEKIIALIMFIGIIISIIFNAFFLNLGWKGEGLALGTVLSQLVIAGLTLFSFNRYSEIQFSRNVYEILLLTIIIIIYSGTFYYMVISNYPVVYLLLCCFIGISAVFIISILYFKIKIIDLFNYIKNAYN